MSAFAPWREVVPDDLIAYRRFPHGPVVYVMFASDGTALYAGNSRHASMRWRQHRHKPWWPRVFRILAVHLVDPHRAYVLEGRVIRTLLPEFNIRGRY